MRKKLKYIGCLSYNNKYKTSYWDIDDIEQIMIYNKLNTKKQIIDYLIAIKIHKNSIKDFMELLDETKRKSKKEKEKEQILKNKTKKMVEKYFK